MIPAPSPYLDVQLRGDGDAARLGDVGERLDAALHAEPLVRGEPGGLRHAEHGAEQLHEHRLPRLHRGALVGERGLEEGGDDVRQGVGHIVLQRRVRVLPAQGIPALVNLQGGRFVMILGSPLKKGLKLHYLVRKQFFSAQNGGRNEIFIV